MFSSGPRRVLYWLSSQWCLVTRLRLLGFLFDALCPGLLFLRSNIIHPKAKITTGAKMGNVKSKNIFPAFLFSIHEINRRLTTDHLTNCRGHELPETRPASMPSFIIALLWWDMSATTNRLASYLWRTSLGDSPAFLGPLVHSSYLPRSTWYSLIVRPTLKCVA